MKTQLIGNFCSHLEDKRYIGIIWVEDGYEMQCDICAKVAVCICISSGENAGDGRICKECAIKAFETFGIGEVEEDYRKGVS